MTIDTHTGEKPWEVRRVSRSTSVSPDDEYSQEMCDGCNKERHVRKLPLDNIPQGAHVYLCVACWRKEMTWREIQNRQRVAYLWQIYAFFTDKPKGSENNTELAVDQ